jgi:hypothetical protein
MSTTSINNLQEAKTQLMDWSTQVNKQTLDPNKIQKITYVFFLSIPLETPITHTYQTVEDDFITEHTETVHSKILKVTGEHTGQGFDHFTLTSTFEKIQTFIKDSQAFSGNFEAQAYDNEEKLLNSITLAID